MALFPKETFEGGSLPASFDSNTTFYGTSGLAINTGSQLQGANSLKVACTAETSAYLAKDMAAGYSELWLQFRIKLPTGWTFPTGGFFTLISMSNTAGSFNFEVKLENNSGANLVLQGTDLPYLATSTIFSLNTEYKVEVYIKKNASTGQVKVWINNNTEGSPDYDSGAQNTGAATLRHLEVGVVYSPATLADFYLDDIIVDTAFIGTGSTIEQEGFRFRADDGSESGATALTSQDTAITRIKNTNTRLRVLMNATGDRPSEQYQLEYRKAGTSDEWHPITS